MRGILSLLLIASATPALADCVTRADLAAGIHLDFQHGRQGSATLESGDVLRIVYDDPGRREVRIARLGIYETAQSVSYGSASGDVVGAWSANAGQMSLSGTPPVPSPGGSWEGVMTGTFTQSDQSGSASEFTLRMPVRYAFLEAREVTVSGCTYMSVPVEATFTIDGGTMVQRFAYFPDLGFGVETQVTRADGQVATNGLTGMGRR